MSSIGKWMSEEETIFHAKRIDLDGVNCFPSQKTEIMQNDLAIKTLVQNSSKLDY